MAIASTTMSTLLSNVKTLLLEYQNTTLSKLATYNRGVLGPTARMPSIALLPVKESYNYSLSNHKYDVDREITLEIYDLKMNTEQAKDNTIELLDAVKEILQADRTISNSCYNSTWSQEVYGSSIDVTRGRLFVSSMNVICKSRESFSDMTTATTISNDIKSTTLQDTILATLKTNKAAYYSTIQTIVDSPIKPIPRFPAIIMGASGKTRNQERPYADISKVYFDISVVSQLFPKETNLNWVLSNTEGVKDVLQANYSWGGYCDYSNIIDITYNQRKSISGYMYSNTITLECSVREYL